MNLVHQSGNAVLESLGESGQQGKFVPLMEFHNTLGTDGSLVSLAVRVDFLVRMHLAMKNPGGRRRGSSLQGLVSGDELVMS